MRKITLIMSLALIMTNLYAQNYQISFAGTGASTSVDSVIVQNLTQCTSKKLVGGDILHLLATGIGINDIDANNTQALYIYPNPFMKYSNIEFEAPVSGSVVIEIYDIAGKEIIKTQYNLQQGRHTFQISGISSGLYTIHVNSEAYSFNGKILSNCNGTGTPNITYQNQSVKTEIPGKTQNVSSEKTHDVKGTASLIQMQYNTGDRLKITGISGISGMYQTIFMLVPTSSQTITFNFLPCTDGDGNNYAIVQIGTQVWMAENLAYLPSVSPSSQGSDTIPYYYVYGYNGTSVSSAKNSTNYQDYGVLYNWPAAMNGSSSSNSVPSGVQGVCPSGWHLPSDYEWDTIVNYLGGSSVACDKMKETGTTHWSIPNTAATNSSGFTALPGGSRGYYGIFDYIGIYGVWWSATEFNAPYTWGRNMDINFSNVHRIYYYKELGISVRCVRD